MVMIKKPVIWLAVILGSLLALEEVPQANAMGSVGSISRYVTKGVKNQAPKNADELPSTSGRSKVSEEDQILDNLLVTRSLLRESQNFACPSMNLRVSAPQLNAKITVPEKLNIRTGPGTNYSRKAQFKRSGFYALDLVNTSGCWVKIRYNSASRKQTGWIYSKLLRIEFDNHLTKPQKRLTRTLDSSGVYRLVARSTYKIGTPTGTGSAVAISPTVLLTNCHVLENNRTAQILEKGRGYKAKLIHDDYSRDKCFIRSLELEVKPIAHVKSFSRIQKGEQAYSVGAPLGKNRSFGKGIVFKGQQRSGDRWILATTPIDFGSSGGGLFDTRGNLIGITTEKTTINNQFAYSHSIAAEDFWK